MEYGLIAIGALCGLVSLVCFIMVVVKMFQHGSTGLGIACIILTFCTGLGPLIAFIMGWVKSAEWGTKKLMLTWTLFFVAELLFLGVGYGMLIPQLQQQIQQQQMQHLGR
jgi:hypothetical protein